MFFWKLVSCHFLTIYVYIRAYNVRFGISSISLSCICKKCIFSPDAVYMGVLFTLKRILNSWPSTTDVKKEMLWRETWNVEIWSLKIQWIFWGTSCNMELWSILCLLKLNLRIDLYSIYFAILTENHKT